MGIVEDYLVGCPLHRAVGVAVLRKVWLGSPWYLELITSCVRFWKQYYVQSDSLAFN